MAISDTELAKKQAYVEKLRGQVAEEEAKRTQREADSTNELAAVQLDAEAARLEAQLQAAKDVNKASAVRSGAAAPLYAAKEDLARAQAVAEAQEKAKEVQAETDAANKEAQEKEAAEAKAAADKQVAENKAAAEKAAKAAKQKEA